MFVRRKPNKSGTVSVQVIEKRGRRNVVLRSIGVGRSEGELERLEAAAHRYIEQIKPQLSFSFGPSEREKTVLELLSTSSVTAIGPELILGKIFDSIGFNALPDTLFRDIVLARLVYPVSKLKTTEYLFQHRGIKVEVDQIYRFLDKLNAAYKSKVEEIAYRYSQTVLGGTPTIVFYDMTTLHFEAENEDDLRKIGFSKDGKFQHPQIMLGLLVGRDGYPISYDIFEGNTFEGKTLLPVLEKVQSRFGLSQPTVVADSALLSEQNIKLLAHNGYTYVIGARIKNESKAVQSQIICASQQLTDGKHFTVDKLDGSKLIVDYSAARARKDAKNREKGIARLATRISSGRLTKESLNNRGYNKFLALKGEVNVSLDEQKIELDKLWDGLKGYVTNSTSPPSEIISHYRQLWKIERAFRISKTDLRIRPIFHRKRDRIEAHICVAFVAYTVFKELERLLALRKIPLSPQKAIELMVTIYQISTFLPDSKRPYSTFASLSPLQQQLLNL